MAEPAPIVLCLTPAGEALAARIAPAIGAEVQGRAGRTRAGITAVGRGQHEGALALGLRTSQVTRFVVLPQALRVIIPPLTSQYLNLTKNSSLAAAIAFPDLVLVFAGTILNQTGQAIEVILLTMLVYLVLSLMISVGMNLFNRRVMRTGGQP